MKSNLLTVVFVVLSTTVFCQLTDYQWLGLIKGVSQKLATNVHVDVNKDIITLGKFSDEIRYYPPTGTANIILSGSDNLFLNKVDENGNLIWFKDFGSGNFLYSEDIVTDIDGNIYVAGGYSGIMSLDDDDIPVITSNGTFDCFVAKFDSEGAPKWLVGFGDIEQDAIEAMSIDNEGNIYVMGYFTGSLAFDPNNTTYDLDSDGEQSSFIAKYDADGNIIWARQLTENTSPLYSPAFSKINANNELLILGSFQDSVRFAGDPQQQTYYSNPSAEGGYLLKLDLNQEGAFISAVSVGAVESGALSLNGLEIDEDNNVYIQSLLRGVVNFGSGADEQQFSSDYYGPLLIKLDSDGAVLWVKQMKGDVGTARVQDIALDGNGNIYHSGTFSGTIDFDLSEDGIAELTTGFSPHNDSEHYISVLTADGDFIMAYKFGGENFNSDIFTFGSDMTIVDDNIYIYGVFQAQIDINPFPDTTTTISTDNANEIYLMKLKYDLLTSTQEPQSSSLPFAYPNPVRHAIMIDKPGQYKKYRILDLVGKELIHGDLQISNGQIDVHSLIPGTYFLQIDGAIVFKIIKQ